MKQYKREIRYFVSFTGYKKGNRIFGNTQVNINRKLNFDIIRKIENEIEY